MSGQYRFRPWQCRSAALILIILAVTGCGALPTFTSSSYVTTVSELTPVGSIIVNITAEPATPGNILTYNIFGHPASIFDINSSTGSVVLVGSLDYEHETLHNFNVEVFEGSDAVMTPVTVDVANDNDEVPLCLSALYTVSIPASSALGDELLSLSCSDSDGDALEFSIAEGDTEGVFELTHTSLSLAAPVDADTLSTYTLLVNVFDGIHTTGVTVYVYIEPSNDHVPTFDQSVYDCSLPESTSIGTVVCSVIATDRDTGLYGIVSYSITSGNDANKFAIDASNGDIVVVGPIDYELVQGYLIIVRATDSGESPLGNSVQVRITAVDANDNAPIISALINASISENSPIGSVVIVPECSDADSGSNAEVQLLIDSQRNDNGTFVEVFKVNSSTNELITDSNIDYEESLFYIITLTCRDSGSPSLASSSTVIVSVNPINEFAPVITEDDYSTTIAENSTVGTSVLQVTAVDSDRGLDGSVVFSIEAEAGRDFLQISQRTGHVTTRELLDCSWGLEHLFTISAADEGTPSLMSQSQLTVRLEYCNLGQLTPSKIVYFASVSENTPTDTEVVLVTCDATKEEYGSPQYSIASPALTPFQIYTLSGWVSIRTPPDYEEATSHMLQVECSDPSNTEESYATFSVYVTVEPENEHTPVFSQGGVYEAEIEEDALPGSSVLGVEAVDGDSGTDGSILYRIQENSRQFVVNPATGVVYNLAGFDREKEGVYLFHVVAVDQLGQGGSVRSAVAEVRVGVTDSNDNSPECDRVLYHTSISPLLEPGDTLVELHCTDADTGPNSELQYTLHAQSSGSVDMFAITEDTGELVLVQKYTSGSATVHEMTITIEDHGEPSRTTVVLVVVDLEREQVTEDVGGTATHNEGSKNTATFTVRDMSLEIWSGGGMESFQEAVAHSVTSHCSLLPESCSLLSGCAQFHSRRKRSVNENLVATFTEDNVVILTESIHEFAGPDGNTYLNLTFYITLPDGVQKADYRTTDYVVPGTTLSLLLRDEGPVIESQVRGKVAPSLTQRSSTDSDHSLDWLWGAVGTLAVVGVCVVVSLLLRFTIHRWKSTKKGVSVSPLNLVSLNQHNRPSNNTKPTSNSKTVDSEHENVRKKRLSLRELLESKLVTDREVLRGGRKLTTQQSKGSFEDDVSTIELAGEDSNECSLQGHPRSRGSLGLSSAVSQGSDGNGQKSGSKSSSVGDYKQNFPYEPPRHT